MQTDLDLFWFLRPLGSGHQVQVRKRMMQTLLVVEEKSTNTCRPVVDFVISLQDLHGFTWSFTAVEAQEHQPGTGMIPQLGIEWRGEKGLGLAFPVTVSPSNL